MSIALYPALVFTVALLVTTAYFLLGGLPLLVLDHDTPLDARFIRGFFNLYYKAAFITAVGTALSYAAWGRPGFAVGAAGLALAAVLLRRRLTAAMDQLASRIQASEPLAIQRFRRVHLQALLVNLLQLVLLVWALTRLAL
ncbi:hypothetical protein [Pseudaquabacterium pictum]|uniref:DUF4149 domain-containing protein n=1 Tax=Pseudaquabacterium pictum TaxID=2315236 RepID=A0A480ALT6_9BURK|nr:hypothetical protein [Rubrivivax pictus]GCL60942.1 hypothetical protein AQPW35_00230 [Rubrivivax pictus]